MSSRHENSVQEPALRGRVTSRETLVRGAKFDLERVRIEADGRAVTREFVRHPGAVCILPILESAGNPPRVVFVRNERHAAGRSLLELPAGTMEPPEPAIDCAARELEEESGYAAAEIASIGAFYTTPGMTNEQMHCFLARDLEHVGQRLEPGELLTVEIYPLSELDELIRCGELVDGKTLGLLQLARAHGWVRLGDHGKPEIGPGPAEAGA